MMLMTNLHMCMCKSSFKTLERPSRMPDMYAFQQVLGRNLEALVTRAQEVKADWRDEFVSVEHMLLAFVDDTKFGTQLLKDANLDKAKIEAAVKEIRGSNRVTDQVCPGSGTQHILLEIRSLQ